MYARETGRERECKIEDGGYRENERGERGREREGADRMTDIQKYRPTMDDGQTREEK